MKVVTGEQMGEIDRLSKEAGVETLELMENAGQAVYETVRSSMGDVTGQSVVIVCGKGNNGGDGLVAARLLHEAGASVRVLLVTAAGDLQGEPRTNLHRAEQAGVSIEVRGPVRGETADAIDAINRSDRHILAVDIPSGVNADTGEVASVAVMAHQTVTLGLPKWGTLTFPGAEYVGRLIVADIGLPLEAVMAVSSQVECFQPHEVAALLPQRQGDAHKGNAGRLLVIAGSVGYTGAAALASMSCLRAGAGLVTLAVPESLNDILEVKVTEVITRPMPETAARSLSIDALQSLLELAAKNDIG